MIEYKYKKRENKFTENGHTMFEEDVLQRLKRLAHIEEQIKLGQLLPIQRVRFSEAEVLDLLTKLLDDHMCSHAGDDLINKLLKSKT